MPGYASVCAIPFDSPRFLLNGHGGDTCHHTQHETVNPRSMVMQLIYATKSKEISELVLPRHVCSKAAHWQSRLLKHVALHRSAGGAAQRAQRGLR